VVHIKSNFSSVPASGIRPAFSVVNQRNDGTKAIIRDSRELIEMDTQAG